MVFNYIACNPQGDIVKGRLNATSEEAVNDIMSYAGYRLINLRPYVPFLSVERLKQSIFKIKPMEIVLLFRQLALLLESGVNIITSLELLQEQITNPNLKKAMLDIVKDLRSRVSMNCDYGVFGLLMLKELNNMVKILDA